MFLPSLAMIRRQVRKVTKLRFVSVIGLGFNVGKDGRYQGFEDTFTAWNVTDLSAYCQESIYGLGRLNGGYILEEWGSLRRAWGSAMNRQIQPRV